MKNFLTLIAYIGFLVSVFSITVAAQVYVPRKEQPTLINEGGLNFRDDAATSENEMFYLRSGKSVDFPVDENAILRGALDANYSTKGNKGYEVFRSLILVTPVRNPFGGQYIGKDSLIDTCLIGDDAGVKDIASLRVEPRTTQIEIKETDYLQIGVKNGYRVFAKPGIWRLRIYTSIRSYHDPVGNSWFAKPGSESIIYGKKFGFEKKISEYSKLDEGSEVLPLIPKVGLIGYVLYKAGKVFKLFLHRPNIVIPASTEFFFDIERIEGTFISAPPPKGPPTVVKR